MKMNFNIFLLLTLGLLLISCEKEETSDATCVKTGLTYTKDIKTLIASCATIGCHNTGSPVGSYANYADTKESFTITASRVIGALKHSNGFSPMPKNGNKLTDCNISKIEAWIAAGMPE